MKWLTGTHELRKTDLALKRTASLTHPADPPVAGNAVPSIHVTPRKAPIAPPDGRPLRPTLLNATLRYLDTTLGDFGMRLSGSLQGPHLYSAVKSISRRSADN